MSAIQGIEGVISQLQATAMSARAQAVSGKILNRCLGG